MTLFGSEDAMSEPIAHGMSFILHRAFPCDFSREIRTQSDTSLHREYNLTMKNKALATQCSTGALLRMLRHGGSQPRKEEGASHPARRGKNAEAFLIYLGGKQDG